MININCKRDKDGFYLLNEIDKSEHVISTGSFSESKQSVNFWIQRDYGAPFLVKYREFPSYIFALYSELIYSEICKRNNIPCANIDVGKYGGNYCVISEDVSVGADERFDAYGLAYLSGLEKDSLYAGNGKEFRKNFYANRLYDYADKIQKTFKHIHVDENFKNDLYKIALMDLLTIQRDRNPTNIMFLLGKKDERWNQTLKVAPIFDNEFSFEFMRLSAFYLRYNIDPVEYAERTKGLISLNSMFNNECLSVSRYVTPIFGTKSKVESFRFPLCMDCEKDTFQEERKKATAILKREYDNFAKIALENKEINSLINNFDFDVFSIAEEIKEKSGFEIPEEYLDISESIIARNLKRLKNRIAKLEQNENQMVEKERGE